eukprot:scaffold4015_cov200-Skeletonema_marinoi.AAC.14
MPNLPMKTLLMIAKVMSPPTRLAWLGITLSTLEMSGSAFSLSNTEGSSPSLINTIHPERF